jgi:hypothetical protein
MQGVVKSILPTLNLTPQTGRLRRLSGVAACPLTARLLEKRFGITVSGWLQFGVAVLIMIAGRIAVVVVLHRPFLPGPWPLRLAPAELLNCSPLRGKLLYAKPHLQATQMITSAIPVVAVSDSTRAEDYYCRVLGFTTMSAYPADAQAPDPRYVAVARDGVWIHLQSYSLSVPDTRMRSCG